MTMESREIVLTNGEHLTLRSPEKKDALFDGERIVGVVSLRSYKVHIKLRHICQVGIGLIKDYWGIGMGKLLMKEAILRAEKLGYEQIELGVLEDNHRAIALYTGLGFSEYGRLRGAYKLKDGRYVDEILMVLAVKGVDDNAEYA